MGISILAIPGIGTQKPGFSTGLQHDVLRYLEGTGLEDNIDFYEVTPFSMIGADIIQEEMFNRLNAHNKLDYRKLRKFILSAFGDAVTFERGAIASDSVYKKVHQILRAKIQDINAAMAPGDLFVIIACSLGVHLISTYIYDCDKNSGIFKSKPADGTDNLHNLKFLASIGCNLPLFVSGIPRNKIEPIDKENRAEGFIWKNYYDQDDLLGWPLQQLSDSYRDLVEDIEINAGFTPLSHVNYWDDNDFTKPFSETLKTL